MKFSFPIQALFLLYRFLWFLATPLLLRSPRLQQGSAERLLRDIRFSKVDLWIHAASVGEAYIAGQILSSFDTNQKCTILVTTNTAQGREILEKECHNLSHDISIAYMIFDNPSLVKKAVAVADPDVLVLIELEIWPALMAEIKRKQKKIIIVNGRMTEKSFTGYKKIAFLWKALKPDVILANSEENRLRLQALFQQPATYYIPNIKFDRMNKCQISKNTKKTKKNLVLASIRKEEEEQVFYIIINILQIFPHLQINLFPRHLHRVESWKKRLSDNNISYSLKTATPDNNTSQVTIWDVFGELINAYQFADAVFVGGSLAPLGGQNFLEAFMNGIIPVTGPSVSNFLWAGKEVFEEGLVLKGNNKEEVLNLLTNVLQNPFDKNLIQQKADNYIKGKQGGSRKTCQHIVDLLPTRKLNEI